MAYNLLNPQEEAAYRKSLESYSQWYSPQEIENHIASQKAEQQKVELLKNRGYSAQNLPSGENLSAVYSAGVAPSLSAEEITNKEKAASAEALKQEALMNAERLKASNYKAITGAKALFSKEGMLRGIPKRLGTGQAYAKESKLYDSLVAALSLEKRSLLKGQGTITDAEFQVLQDAATTLSTDLTNEEFGVELQKTIDALSGTLEQKVMNREGMYAGSEWDAMRQRISQQPSATPPVLGTEEQTSLGVTPPVLGEKKMR